LWNLGHALCTICGAKLVPDSICPRLWKFPIQQLQPLTSFRLFNSPRKTPVQRPPRSFFERGHCQLSSKGNIEQNLVQESAFSSYPPSFNLFVQDLNSYPPSNRLTFVSSLTQTLLTEFCSWTPTQLSGVGEHTCDSRVIAQQVMTITADIGET